MQLPARPMPRPTAQVAPFFDILGAELTVQFLLQFGGAELYLSADPKGRSAVETLIGPDRLKALATSDHRALQRRIPLAKPWLAAMLHWQGHSTAHIARTLRATSAGRQVMLCITERGLFPHRHCRGADRRGQALPLRRH